MWIWRYELSYANSFTFMMPFIGARSRTWQSVIWYNGSMADMVDHYRCTVLYCTVLYCTWWTTGAASALLCFYCLKWQLLLQNTTLYLALRKLENNCSKNSSR